MAVIGIDLGTTNSLAAYWKNGETKIIPNSVGNSLTPSVVSIDENNELSAKIVDSETGNQSKTTITLVSRTQEERLITDEYNIAETQENF